MSAARESRSLLRFRPLQLAALAGFLTFIGGFAFYTKLCVIDNDIWWHLKVGDWIVAHMAVPHTGILSRTAANRPWVAYSWGYEVLMSLAYKWLGLLGIGLYGTLLTIAVAYATYWMLRRVSSQFWVALVLAALTSWAFLFNGMPRPVFFSIVLFCITLELLLNANRTGRIEGLYWLPLIFFVWANLHIQFIYGLFLVGLLVATTGVQRLAQVAEVLRWEFSAEPRTPLPQDDRHIFICDGRRARIRSLDPEREGLGSLVLRETVRWVKDEVHDFFGRALPAASWLPAGCRGPSLGVLGGAESSAASG